MAPTRSARRKGGGVSSTQSRSGSGGTFYGLADPRPDPPSEFETILQLWLERPARVREEREIVQGFGESDLHVRDGDRWWHYSPSQGAIGNDGDPNHQSGVGQEVDQRLLVLETQPDEPWRQAGVVCERGGTAIQLTSDLDLETMLELADSLVPAPTDPPRLD